MSEPITKALALKALEKMAHSLDANRLNFVEEFSLLTRFISQPDEFTSPSTVTATIWCAGCTPNNCQGCGGKLGWVDSAAYQPESGRSLWGYCNANGEYYNMLFDGSKWHGGITLAAVPDYWAYREEGETFQQLVGRLGSISEPKISITDEEILRHFNQYSDGNVPRIEMFSIHRDALIESVRDILQKGNGL